MAEAAQNQTGGADNDPDLSQQHLELAPDPAVEEQKALEGALASVRAELDAGAGMAEVSSNGIAAILKAMSKGVELELSPALAAEMSEAGLVDVKPVSTYHEEQRKVGQIEALQEEHESKRVDLENLPFVTSYLKFKTNPAIALLRRISPRTSKETVEAEKLRRQELEKLEPQLKEELPALQQEIELRKELRAELEPYSKTSEGYMKLTSAGESLLADIAAREARLGNRPYAELSEELEQLKIAVTERMERFGKVLELLKEEEWDTSDSRVVDFALSLSLKDGDLQQNYDRAMVVNGVIYNDMDGTSYDRLRSVVAVAEKDGDVEELSQELVRTHNTLVEQHSMADNYETLAEAAALVGGAAGSDQMIERMEGMRDALAPRGWSHGSHATCWISSKLAHANSDNHEEVADRHHKIERALIQDGGISDSVESGLAALVLFGADGSPEELTERFMETFNAMQEAGWDHYRDYYPVAAALSRLPGETTEKVKVLTDIKDQLVEEGWKYNVASRSMAIFADLHGDAVRRGLRGATLNPDTFESPYASSGSGGYGSGNGGSGSGFNGGWALAGDLIDDGSVNLSGGFWVGGLLGG